MTSMTVIPPHPSPVAPTHTLTHEQDILIDIQVSKLTGPDLNLNV